MCNCKEVEEHAIPINQVESGVQMMSTHKCKKTYYAEAQDGSFHSFEVNALIAPVKQDLIGGRAITNALKFQVILDEDPNICGLYPRVNGKLLGVEESIPFISDDPRLFRIKTLQISHNSFVNQTGLDLWHGDWDTWQMSQ